MRSLTFLLLFGLIPFFLQAQSNLSGRISNLSEAPFGYCKLILGQDSVAVQTVDADSSGTYLFGNLSDGTYQLQIILPFKLIDTTVAVSGFTTFHLMVDDNSYLEEVVIVGKQQTIIRKVDRTIFNPAAIPALVGGDASDVIEFAPGVYISGDNIHVVGGSTAQVMLNDKLIPLSGSQLVSFIRSIPAEDIQYIEVIPIPPVKYGAAVRGSLINIRLVTGAKSRQSKGNISGEIGQRFYAEQGASGNYSHRAGRFSLYANAGLDHSKYRPTGEKTIDFDTILWNESSTKTNQNLDFRGSVGMNYEINPSTEIGILGFTNAGSFREYNQSSIEKRGSNDSLVGLIANVTDDLSDNRKNSVNINLSKRLDTVGRKLDFNTDFTRFSKQERIKYGTRTSAGQNDSLNSETNRLLTTAQFFSGGIDYVHPIKKMTLSTGARYSYTTNRNELSVFNNLSNPDIADTLKSNAFNYFEHIQAGYVSLDWKLKKWSFQAGLRGENTWYVGDSPTTGFQTRKNYFQLVPKVFVLYETKKGNAWNLSYSRDFYRPAYTDLNPFRYYTSNYSYKTGNPALKPSVHHSLSLSTGIHDFQFNLYLTYGLRGESSVTIYDHATQLQQTTVANLYSDRSALLVVNYYKLIRKKISIDAMVLGSFSNTTVSDAIAYQKLNNFMTMVNLGFSYVLDKRESFIFKSSCFYMTPFYQQITRKTEFPYLALSLTKNLLKNRISLKLSASDPFRIAKSKTTTQSNQTVVRDDFYYDSQAVRFSFTYKFGNNQLSVKERRTNTTGEADRIGK